MISSLQIEGYRGFQKFQMAGLGRVNLLVGTNNSGKTSVLEAIYLLASSGDPVALWQVLWRRGERWSTPERSRDPQTELDVAHLFVGHEAKPGSRILLSSSNSRSLSLSIRVTDRVDALASALEMEIEGNPKPPFSLIPLNRQGGMSSDALEIPRRARQGRNEVSPAQFITTESLTGEGLVELWNRIALTPSEGLVLQALQSLDPAIERIAPQISTRSFGHPRGGFLVKRAGMEHPIPIGSLGDGTWRMLAMAIALTQCRGGVLLVDQIDTGLHYTVMSQMWKLIYNAARDLDVQVFASTHSYDCVYSLAQICPDTDAQNGITVQRIEPGKGRAVPYDESEIAVTAAREIEVR